VIPVVFRLVTLAINPRPITGTEIAMEVTTKNVDVTAGFYITGLAAAMAAMPARNEMPYVNNSEFQRHVISLDCPVFPPPL
jgi:acetylglutamate synthase